MHRFLLVLGLLWTAAPPARADAVSELERYVDWRGGPAFLRLSSLHERGEVEVAGLKGTAELWEDRTRLRSDADLGVLKTAEAVTPTDAWQMTQSGVIENASEARVREARREALLLFGGALRGEGGAHASLQPTEARDGLIWGVVRISFGDDDHYDLFIDQETGALHGLRVYENRRTRFERFEDWRLVDGVRMPFLERTESDLKGQDSTLRWTLIEVNRPIEDARFARPASARKVVFAPGAASTGWIDFEFFDGNRIYFNARINGRETVVLLDSGAETTFLDKGFAASLGLKPQGGMATVGTGGSDTAGLVGGVTVEIGALKLADLTVATLDLAPIGKRIGHPLPVVLGNEVFNELVVDIDFEHHRLAFRDPGVFTPPAGAAEVPARLVDGIRAVPVSVEGRAPVSFDFDLGNGSPLLVFPAYWQKEKLLEGRPHSAALGGAIGGIHPETVATVRSMTFAGVTFADVPTVFTPEGPSAVDTSHTLGNVGLPILARFHLITDYPHDRLWLTPYPDQIGRPFPKDRLGLAMQPDGAGYVVEFVAPGSPAEGAGFKAGEKVRLVERKPRDAWTDQTLRALSGGRAGTVLEFTLADGAVRRVRLAEYY